MKTTTIRVLTALFVSATCQAQICPIGTNYCSTSPTSVSGGAVISANGDASGGSGTAFTLTATGVPNDFGLFYYGPTQISAVFGNGFRCVGAPTTRISPAILAVGNVAAVTVAGTAFAPSSTHNFQYWFRDVAAGGASFNLSDGLNLAFDGSGCPHLGINKVAPNAVSITSQLQVTGAGFGNDPDDLCMIISDGTQAAFTRVSADSQTAMSGSLRAIPAGMTSGNVSVALGDGRSMPIAGLSSFPDVTFTQDPWGWLANGGPTATSQMTVNLTPGSATPPPPPSHCQYFVGGLQADGSIELVFPAGLSCPPGGSVDIALHGAQTLSGSWHGDWHCVYTSSATLGPCECAARVASCWSETWFLLHGIFMPAPILVIPSGEDCSLNPEVRLKFFGPSGEQFIGGWADALICP